MVEEFTLGSFEIYGQAEEEKKDDERSNSSSSREKGEVAEEEVKEENKSAECEGEFSQIFEVVRGVERLAVRQEFGLVVVTGEGGAQSGGHRAQ